jgi:hypothetical protein
MAGFMEASKSYVARIGDLPPIAFEADDDMGFIQLLRETMNAVESLQDLDGRVAIDFARPDKTVGRIMAGDARRHRQAKQH